MKKSPAKRVDNLWPWRDLNSNQIWNHVSKIFHVNTRRCRPWSADVTRRRERFWTWRLAIRQHTINWIKVGRVRNIRGMDYWSSVAIGMDACWHALEHDRRVVIASSSGDSMWCRSQYDVTAKTTRNSYVTSDDILSRAVGCDDVLEKGPANDADGIGKSG